MDYRRIRALTCAAIGLLLSASAAAAQTSENLSSLLPDLILHDIVLPTPAQAIFSHSVHFSPFQSDDPNNPAVGIVESVNKLIADQLSAFPLGSSSGGFTYTFDSELGTFR